MENSFEQLIEEAFYKEFPHLSKEDVETKGNVNTLFRGFIYGAKWAMEHFRVSNPQVERVMRALKYNEAESAKVYTPEHLRDMDDVRDAWVKK